MKKIKIHTSNKEKVLKILKNTYVSNDFFTYNLSYKVLDSKNHKFRDLKNEHYFNLPEFAWSRYILERHIVEVIVNNATEKTALFDALGVEENNLPYIHFELKEHPQKNHQYAYTHKIYPTYPIYVITKGRWETPLTINALEKMGISFNICVEPEEYDNYAKHVDENKIIVLPENFSKRGEGSIPVRNFVWEHAVNSGHKKHWILDDNISWFSRWNLNIERKIHDGVFFKVMEDFSDRYENLGLVGPQYSQFVIAGETEKGQFVKNTRVYSCILINNKLLDQRLDERWRGTYNEDTDLTLRVLSTGDLCTVSFNTLLIKKITTGYMRGGNTDTIYDNGSNSGYMKKFNELKETWGDIVKFTNRFHKDGRPHHIIPYTKLFKQDLIFKPNIPRTPKINNYNMILKEPTKDEEQYND